MISDGAGDHQRQLYGIFVEYMFTGEHCCFGIQGVEDGLDQQQIGATLDQAANCFGIGLHQLIAMVPTDQPQFIKAFVNLGFESEFVHQDYAMLQDGRTLDVAELVLYLVDHSGEF